MAIALPRQHGERPNAKGGEFRSAALKSFYEVHLAAIRTLPHGTQTWVVPEAGFGVSMLHVTDQIDALITYSNSYQLNGVTYTDTYQLTQSSRPERTSFSPLARLGLTLFPHALFSVQVDVPYVGYANTVGASGQTFDLGFSGVTYRIVLQLRL